jgi:hypothetical protein
MKYLLLLALIAISFSSQAQFFQKSPVPGASAKFAAVAPTTQNFIKPIIGVTASVSNGASLGGGVGISFQHSKSNAATNSWDIQYSISGIAFLSTNGTKISGIGGLIFGIPGTGGLIQIGPGYDFGNKQVVLLTGVGITIF